MKQKTLTTSALKHIAGGIQAPDRHNTSSTTKTIQKVSNQNQPNGSVVVQGGSAGTIND